MAIARSKKKIRKTTCTNSYQDWICYVLCSADIAWWFLLKLGVKVSGSGISVVDIGTEQILRDLSNTLETLGMLPAQVQIVYVPKSNCSIILTYTKLRNLQHSTDD